GFFGQTKKKRKMTVAEALDYMIQEEENRLIDMDQVTRIAVERAEQMGIIFIDEIDKTAGRELGHGPHAHRRGVQRDILPTGTADSRLARYAALVNEQTENIGARRLHTILEKVLDEISFEAPDLKKKTIKIDVAYVTKQLADIVKNQDLSRYIL